MDFIYFIIIGALSAMCLYVLSAAIYKPFSSTAIHDWAIETFAYKDLASLSAKLTQANKGAYVVMSVLNESRIRVYTSIAGSVAMIIAYAAYFLIAQPIELNYLAIGIVYTLLLWPLASQDFLFRWVQSNIVILSQAIYLLIFILAMSLGLVKPPGAIAASLGLVMMLIVFAAATIASFLKNRAFSAPIAPLDMVIVLTSTLILGADTIVVFLFAVVLSGPISKSLHYSKLSKRALELAVSYDLIGTHSLDGSLSGKAFLPGFWVGFILVYFAINPYFQLVGANNFIEYMAFVLT